MDEIDVVIQAPHHQSAINPDATAMRQRGQCRTVGAVGLCILGKYAGVGQCQYLDGSDGRKKRLVVGSRDGNDRQLTVLHVAAMQHDEVGAAVGLTTHQVRRDRLPGHQPVIWLHTDLPVR